MASNNPQAAAREARHEEVGIRRVNEFFVRLSMRHLPDPYLFVSIVAQPL